MEGRRGRGGGGNPARLGSAPHRQQSKPSLRRFPTPRHSLKPDGPPPAGPAPPRVTGFGGGGAARPPRNGRQPHGGARPPSAHGRRGAEWGQMRLAPSPPTPRYPTRLFLGRGVSLLLLVPKLRAGSASRVPPPAPFCNPLGGAG